MRIIDFDNPHFCFISSEYNHYSIGVTKRYK